jgi:hypothetical protein
MEDQANDSRRDLLPADAAWLEERRFGRRADLVEGALDRRAELREQLGSARWRTTRLTFRPDAAALLSGELLGARIREEAIEGAAKVPDVKPNRGGAAGPSPDLIGGQTVQRPLHILACVDEGVGGGHEQRGYTTEGAALPGFEREWSRHEIAIIPGNRPSGLKLRSTAELEAPARSPVALL